MDGRFSCTRSSVEDDASKDFTRNLHTLSSGLLPTIGSAGSAKSRDHGMRKYIIPPYNDRYWWWQKFLVLLVVYCAWITPFQLAFSRVRAGRLFIFDNVVNLFFAIDIGLTFFVAYLDKSTYILVDDPMKIATRYLARYFLLDVASTIPFQLLFLIFTGKINTGLTFRILNLLRLWRLRRVSVLFSSLEKDIRINYFLVRCIKMVLVTVFTVHCGACFFFLQATRYHDEMDTWIWSKYPNFKERSIYRGYITAIYWSTTTYVTLGYGDIYAVNTLEKAWDSLYMFLSLGINAYIIGNMTNLIVSESLRTLEFRAAIGEATEFAAKNRLPESMKEQIIGYITLKFRSVEMKRDEILLDLPKALRSNILQELFLAPLGSCYLFNGVSKDTMLQLVSEVEAEYFPPKVDIIMDAAVSNDFYVVVFGEVDITNQRNGNQQVVEKLTAPALVGEIGVFCNMPQPFTVRTKSLCQLLKMKRVHFFDVLKRNVSDGKIIASNFLERLKALSAFLPEEFQLFLDLKPQHFSEDSSSPTKNSVTFAESRQKIRSLVVEKPVPEKYKRVSLFWCSEPGKHIDSSGHEHRPGKMIWLPPTLEEIARVAGDRFDKTAAHVSNAEGAEIMDVEAVRDNDILFLH